MRPRSQKLPFLTQLWVEETEALGDFRVTAVEKKVLVPNWKGGGLVRQKKGMEKKGGPGALWKAGRSPCLFYGLPLLNKQQNTGIVSVGRREGKRT